MHEFWYDYNKRKYQDNGKLYYTGTDSFLYKTRDVYNDIANDFEKRLGTSN